MVYIYILLYTNIGGILMVNVTIYGSTMDPMGNSWRMDVRLRVVSRVDTTPLHVVKQSCTAIYSNFMEDGHLDLPTTRFEGWNKQRNITTTLYHTCSIWVLKTL